MLSSIKHVTAAFTPSRPVFSRSLSHTPFIPTSKSLPRFHTYRLSTTRPCTISQATPPDDESAVVKTSPTIPPKSPSTSKLQYSQRARLREETEAPFRKARMFVYAGSAISAGVGAFIATLRIIAALVGISGVQPLNETIPNVAINLTVITICALLLRVENKAGERRLERMSRGARIANLRIEDAVTRTITPLKELRGKTRVVLIAGNAQQVRNVMSEAEQLRDEISKINLLIVPFVSDAEHDGRRESWRMNTYGREDWKRWLDSERHNAKKQFQGRENDLLVLILRLDGKVGARSLGAPSWSRLVDEVARLPTRDQYGRP